MVVALFAKSIKLVQLMLLRSFYTVLAVYWDFCGLIDLFDLLVKINYYPTKHDD